MNRDHPSKKLTESFRFRIFAILTLLILITSCAFIALYVHHESSTLKSRLVTEGELLARLLANNSRLAVFAEQQGMLMQAADDVLKYHSAIVSATIYATDGTLLIKRVRRGKDGIDRGAGGASDNASVIARLLKEGKNVASFEKDDSFEFFAPVVAGTGYSSPESLFFSDPALESPGGVLGGVRVILEKRELNESRRRLLANAGVMAAIFLVLASIIAYLVARRVTRPLTLLLGGVKTLGTGDLSGRVPVISEDELGQVSHAFNTMAEALERRDAENKALGEQLRLAQKEKAREEWERTFDTMPDSIAILDSEDRIVRINGPMAEHLGMGKSGAVGAKLYELLHLDGAPIDLHGRTAVLAAGAVCFGEVHDKKLNRYFFVTVSPCMSSDGLLTGSVYVARDITERRNLQIQLFYSQKMEAIGQIAGGVAHDFNNLLTAIIGFGNLADSAMDADDPIRQYVAQILSAAERAAKLTQGLLAFSSRQIIDPHPMDVNEVVRNMQKLLARLITEDVEMKSTLLNEELIIMADSTQIDQILMNLAANARDAMPKGGVLSIETCRFVMTSEYVRDHGYGVEGAYAVLSVSDTGTGMPEVTRARIFEPFFSTKEVGKGTGLGLSIVYGIVKQHNGFINVYSEPGEGTVFRIYLPLIRAEKVPLHQTEVSMAIRGGSETVLVVEDNPDVRNLTRALLEAHGYRVIEAVDGQDGVEKFALYQDEINLVISDVVMPKLSGKDAAARMEELRPGVKVLFTSGYTQDIVHEKGILLDGISFISKPSTPREMLRMVRELLDRPS